LRPGIPDIGSTSSEKITARILPLMVSTGNKFDRHIKFAGIMDDQRKIILVDQEEIGPSLLTYFIFFIISK
jgi:hypothetical protein